MKSYFYWQNKIYKEVQNHISNQIGNPAVSRALEKLENSLKACSFSNAKPSTILDKLDPLKYSLGPPNNWEFHWLVKYRVEYVFINVENGGLLNSTPENKSIIEDSCRLSGLTVNTGQQEHILNYICSLAERLLPEKSPFRDFVINTAKTQYLQLTNGPWIFQRYFRTCHTSYYTSDSVLNMDRMLFAGSKEYVLLAYIQ